MAADLVGIAQKAMEMAVEYAKDRKQFDRPIGAYQGVSHLCAQMLYDVEETGYPDRMRKKIEQERILRKREEQKERRAKFERGENPYS